MKRPIKVTLFLLIIGSLSLMGFERVDSSIDENDICSDGFINGHEYIDLGLPSGTLWATCNVGAYKPESIGALFAWGETIDDKDAYNWDTYRHSVGYYDITLKKYCNKPSCGYNGYSDSFTTLLPWDDAATVNWGNGWRTPTRYEWQELVDNTSCTMTTRNGVKVLQFTAANGKKLFLPGYVLYGYWQGNYWSSTLNTYDPYQAINFSVYYQSVGGCPRYCEGLVRPVRY